MNTSVRVDGAECERRLDWVLAHVPAWLLRFSLVRRVAVDWCARAVKVSLA